MAALVNRHASGVRDDERRIHHRTHAAGVGIKRLSFGDVR